MNNSTRWRENYWGNEKRLAAPPTRRLDKQFIHRIIIKFPNISKEDVFFYILFGIVLIFLYYALINA